MIAALGLSSDYRYVVAVAVSTGFLTSWQSFLVSAARKSSGVKYPAVYASDAQAEKDINAMKFNCAQRAHGNTLESLPFFLFSLLYTGLEYPLLATAFGLLWISGRVLYTQGYVSGTPSKRMRGVHHNLGYFGLLFTSAYVAGKSLLA